MGKRRQVLHWDFRSSRQTGSLSAKVCLELTQLISCLCACWHFFLSVLFLLQQHFNLIFKSRIRVGEVVFMMNKWGGIKLIQGDSMLMGLACNCRHSTKGRNRISRLGSAALSLVADPGENVLNWPWGG